MIPFKAFRDQLGKLQRLAQPYFLPLDNDATPPSSWCWWVL
jgi:hypothetical protein